MSENKFSWDLVEHSPIQRKLNPGFGKKSYNSIGEFLDEKAETLKKAHTYQLKMNQYLPALMKLLQIRQSNNNSILMKSRTFYTTEVWRGSTNPNEELRGAFSEEPVPIQAGTEFFYKGFIDTLKVHVFENDTDVYEISDHELKNILINSDLFEVVDSLFQGDK